MKFEDLEVWKRSSRLCADLYKHFQDIKDFAGFLQYSKGSCGELRTQIYIGIDMLLLTTDNCQLITDN